MNNEKTALLVEDDCDAASIINIILSKLGYTVRWAESISQAKNILNNQPLKDFELLFLDLTLSDGISLDLFKEFSLKKIPRKVLCSAYLNDETIIEAKQLGITTVMKKPINQQKIITALQ